MEEEKKAKQHTPSRGSLEMPRGIIMVNVSAATGGGEGGGGKWWRGEPG
jgi:hypothetical protein